MNEADFTTCAWCPRLCRHVCPVAVGSAQEAATPSALMTAPLLVDAGVWTRAEGVSATDLCLGCGACTAHCKLHVPVAERLMGWRASPPDAAPLQPIVGDDPIVALYAGKDGRLAGASTRMLTEDDLGHAAWKAGNSHVLVAVAAHFSGRRVRTALLGAAEVLAAAAVPVERLPTPDGRVFHTCFEGARPGPSQLACCGRRDGFAGRRPEEAAAIARENVRLLDGSVVCADQACAEWLRANGGDVRGPVDILG